MLAKTDTKIQTVPVSPAALSSRRQFLGATALAAGLAGVGSLLDQKTVIAAEPPQRTGKPYMKLSLAAYSFNRMLQRHPTPEQLESAGMTLEKFISYCASQDLAGTELTSYYVPKFVNDQPVLNITGEVVKEHQQAVHGYLNALKLQCFKAGLDVSGTAIGNDFCVPAGPAREEQLSHCKHWINNAAILGAPVIRIFAGKVPKGDNEDAAIERCIAGINECLDHAAGKGVMLALENHGGITATPAQMLRIIQGVKDSPWFGVNLDGGNFRTDDPYRDLAAIAPYAVNAQVKVAITKNGKKQPADLDRVINILKDAGYRGYVVLEYEEKDPQAEIPKYLDQLRKLIES